MAKTKVKAQAAKAPAKKERDLLTVGWAFMVVGTVILGLAIIPLAWCLPMTIIARQKIKKGQELGVGFKVCTLLFVNLVAGILLLCD